MNLSLNVLQRHIQLNQSPKELRHLLDDIGIEVKRMEDSGDDIVYGLELLANRGDHHCYLGIAREISGRTGNRVCGPLSRVLTLGQEISVQNHTELCLRYTATPMSLTGERSELSEIDLQPLEAAGIHSLTAPVDATNLSNLEIGQPTHVFDADKIDGTIHIRLSTEGERAWLLFEEDARDIPAGTIVIADDSKILAIAGVIGCEDSKTTEETTNIIIESACFDPVSVRKTGRALGLHTDALARFERGSDPELAIVGAGRVVELLETVGWSVTGTTTQVGDWYNEHRHIGLDISALNNFLGTSLSSEDVVERLTRYGFVCEASSSTGLQVEVPTHRIWDVENAFDLYEEIAKSVGYNSIPTTLPTIDKGAVPSILEQNRDLVEETLIGSGFFEVITDGFYGRTDLEKMGLPANHMLHDHVETQNSLDKGYSLLKNNCLLQAVQAVQKNAHRGLGNLKMYEWTRTFHLDSNAANGVCTERQTLWLMAAGMEHAKTWQGKSAVVSPLYLKGLVQELSVTLGLPFAVREADENHPLYLMLHPHRQATIWLGEECVGVLGEVHPRICKTMKIKKVRPCYLELEQSILEANDAGRGYALPPVHQPLVRTVSFSLPHRFSASIVQNTLAESGARVGIIDLFEFENDHGVQRAITFELTFDNPEGRLTADECNQKLTDAMALVLNRHQSQGVEHR